MQRRKSRPDTLPPDVVGVRGLSGLFVKLGRVPGGYSVRPLNGGPITVVSKGRIVRHKEVDFMARYSGMSSAARTSAIVHTSLTRAEESLRDRAKTKAKIIRKLGGRK